MAKDPKSSLDELNRKMYTKDFREVPIRNTLAENAAPEVSDTWSEDSFSEGDFGAERGGSGVLSTAQRFARWALYGAALFLAVAIVFGAVSYFRGTGISSKNVSITIEGPGTASGGEELLFDVVVRNSNNATLEQGMLVLHLPQGMLLVTETGTQTGTVRVPVESIASQGTLRSPFRVIPYGAEKEEQTIIVTLEFRFFGQSAQWDSKSEYPFTITSSPVNLGVSAVEEVSAGQVFTMTVKIESNTEKSLPNALLLIEYPQGFRRTSATPTPTFGENIWRVGDVAAGAPIEVRLAGVMEGDAGQDQVFKITLGEQSDRDERAIDTIYNAVSHTVRVNDPFIAVSMNVNGDPRSGISVGAGQPVRVDLDWQNMTDSQIVDAEISVKVTGNALDRYSVAPNGGGFYNSKNDTVIWTKQGIPSLGVVNPGDRGTVSFGFKTFGYDTAQGKRLRNATFLLEVSVRGRRISSTNVSEQIDTFLTRSVKVDTQIGLGSKALYYGSKPFVNTGPMPPRPEQETTYTIVLSVSNVSNDAQDVMVRTSLPIYMRFMGTVSPSSEKLTNPVGNEIVWDVGVVKAGVGVTAPPREVAFQVGMTPSISQIGESPALTDTISLTAKDTFTAVALSAINQGLTTQLLFDSQARYEDSEVVE